MILDASTQLTNAYAPTTVGTNVTGDYIDRNNSSTITGGEAGVTFGPMYDGMGADVIYHIFVPTAWTTSAGATVNFALQGADDTAFSVNVNTWVQTGATAAATFTAGTQYDLKLPRGLKNRYFRTAVIIATGVTTAGAVSTWLTNDDVQDNVSYPAGFNIKH